MLDMVKARLQSFGYEIKDGDETILNFCMDLDGVVSVMAEGVAEAIDTAAEGVHE